MTLEFTIQKLSPCSPPSTWWRISAPTASNWLEGVQLIRLYLVLAMLFYYLPAH